MQLTLFVIVLKWNRYFLKIFKDSQFLLNNSARNFYLDQSSDVSEPIDLQQPTEMLKSFANAMEEASTDFIIEKTWKSTVFTQNPKMFCFLSEIKFYFFISKMFKLFLRTRRMQFQNPCRNFSSKGAESFCSISENWLGIIFSQKETFAKFLISEHAECSFNNPAEET